MAENRKELTSAEIRRLIGRLDDELARRGQTVTMYVVGGANIALTVDNSRTTTDIDAVIKSGYDQVIAAARAVAATESGLGDDWINSDFTGGDNPTGGIAWQWFDLRGDDTPLSFYRGEALTVEGASAEMMLALKTITGRNQDLADIYVLMRTTGIRTPEELGRNLARFTGRRVFDAQGTDSLHPRIDPRFRQILDNAPEDLRALSESGTGRCGVTRETVRDGVVVRRVGCAKRAGHRGGHRFTKRLP